MADNLTDRQALYFASMRAGLEGATGKSLAEWTAIARTCPETKHRARLAWFKAHHGLGQNRASLVLAEAFDASNAWAEPRLLVESLWSDPASRALYECIDDLAGQLAGVKRTARKGYTAWSRQFQFAAARPMKDGALMLGLALPAAEGREAPRREPWSERLTSRVRVDGDLPAELSAWLNAAWAHS